MLLLPTSRETPKITVLIADDHVVVREGLRAMLREEHDIQIVGEADTGREAVRLAKILKPDVVVMDIAMRQLNGLEATRQIIKKVPRSRVLILSAYNDEEFLDHLAKAGAAGYLLKQTAFAEVLRGIREVRNGNRFFSSAVAKRLVQRFRETIVRDTPVRKQTDLLTPRQVEVLQLIAEGQSNKQIAADLEISMKMVEKHRQRLMNKLAIHNVAGLTRYAIDNRIIETSAAARKAKGLFVPPLRGENRSPQRSAYTCLSRRRKAPSHGCRATPKE